MRVLRWLADHRLFVLVFVTFAYFHQGSDPNQTTRFLLTRAIVERGAADITPWHTRTIDKSEKDGRFYCDKAPGASWLAVPPYAVVHWIAGSKKPSAAYLNWAAWLCTVFAVGIPSALGAVAYQPSESVPSSRPPGAVTVNVAASAKRGPSLASVTSTSMRVRSSAGIAGGSTRTAITRA